MKRLPACLVAALLALVPFSATAADPYDIYVIAPLTGSSAFLGKEESNAIGVIQDVVNKSGGIRGRPIRFIVQDDQSIVQNSVELLNTDIAKKVPLVLGASSVANCSAMAPLVANGPVVYCFSPGIHPPPGSYVFSASISTGDFVGASIRYLRGRGWRKVAIMTSNDATGQDAERSIDAAVNAPENQGTVTLVDREHFNPADLSVAAQMAHIKSSGAQAAILWTVGTSFGTLLRESVQGGLDIPLVTSSGNLNYAQLESYQSFIPDNLYMMAPPWAAPSQLSNRAVRTYINDYLNAFKAAGVRPDEGQSLAWDPVMLSLDALRHLGLDATPTQIRDYIAGLKGWTGVNGQYDFQKIPQRGIGINWLVMVRWDKNSQGLVGVSKAGGDPL
jgi:branched-chain amino acid transport system substrate-binding protein